MFKRNCRMCKSENLIKFLDLGFSPPSDNFLTEEQTHHKEIYYPLDVYSCRECGLCQLGYVVPPELMFNENYPYESSTTKGGREHFFSMAEKICKKFPFKKNSLVIDIGSNVGVLLTGFKKQNMRVLGIEPSSNVAKKANQQGIETISEFFNQNICSPILKKTGKASIITCTNVFAHVDDLDDFVKTVLAILEDDGIFVIEAPYFGDLLEQIEYDTIYHEHLSYLSLKPMKQFFENHNMNIFDITKESIHGGTCRYYISKKGQYPINKNIDKFLDDEKKLGIHSEQTLQKFSEKVYKHRLEFNRLLANLRNSGKRVVGISAPAKGNTLLNFCRIGPETIEYLTERTKSKIGKVSPGTHIPIFSDEKILQDKPDYAVILAWNFGEEIMRNNKKFLEQGGKFIIPIPKPVIIETLN